MILRAPLGPIVIGLGGAAVLAGLGKWQLDRLEWKNGLIAEAERRLDAAPEPLPADPQPERDDYKPVFVEGVFDHAEERYVLTSLPPYGPGFKVVTPLEIPAGRILVDRGFVPQAERAPEDRSETPPPGTVRIEGVLRWPDDTTWATPDPDPEIREWYARDVISLADATGAKPILVVQKPQSVKTWPRGTEPRVTFRNQHLSYAITWFALAAVWIVMALVWFRKLARESRAA